MHKILEQIFHFLKNKNPHLLAITKTLLRIIKMTDKSTFIHSIFTTAYCHITAEKLALSPADRERLYFASLLHDTGKIIVGKEIILKKTPLTPAEWKTVKKHPLYSTRIIKSLGIYGDIADIVKHHHEKFDGSGYPEGLKGEDIPAFSRILAVADSFEAMTGNRPYKPRLSFDEALAELDKCSGSQFDPIMVKLFIEALKENKECAEWLQTKREA